MSKLCYNFFKTKKIKGGNDVLSLIGVFIIIIGFILKIDTLAIVVVAGIATGFVGGLDFNGGSELFIHDDWNHNDGFSRSRSCTVE